MRADRRKIHLLLSITVAFLCVGSVYDTVRAVDIEKPGDGPASNPVERAGAEKGSWGMHAPEDTSSILSETGGDFMVTNQGPENVHLHYETLDSHGNHVQHHVPLGKGDSHGIHGAVGQVLVTLDDAHTRCMTSKGVFWMK